MGHNIVLIELPVLPQLVSEQFFHLPGDEVGVTFRHQADHQSQPLGLAGRDDPAPSAGHAVQDLPGRDLGGHAQQLVLVNLQAVPCRRLLFRRQRVDVCGPA